MISNAFSSCSQVFAEKPPPELMVFHAGSLSVPFRLLAKEFMAENPGVEIKLESAGSRACARKITDLKKACDVMASADYAVIDTLLIPQWAKWNIRFAVNEIGLAYHHKSRRAGEMASSTWADILLDPAVAYGRSDPNSDPCGYRTVLVFHLAETFLGQRGLANKLLEKDARFIRPKETDLIALLESGALDYFFIYRSVAVQHNLSFLRFPPELNLADPTKASFYAGASVTLTGSEPGATITRVGEPIVYGVTIPTNAPNPELAMKFVTFLLSADKGAKILAEQGQEPLVPGLVQSTIDLPEALRPLVKEVR